MWDPAQAREVSVFQRLGHVPVLLSTPTGVDLRVDPADLVERLTAYVAAGATASEADLFLAMTRTNASLVTDKILAELDELPVPVVFQSGEIAPLTAGPAVRRSLIDPLREPEFGVNPDQGCWLPAPVTVPSSFAQLPRRIGRSGHARLDLTKAPTWGDSSGIDVRFSEASESGLMLRQVVRRSSPLTPGSAINMIGAQRGFHPAAMADGATAIHEAWNRGLLRPGAADARLLDWNRTPSHLAALARVCGELADEGLLSVVWPVLDGVLVASLRAPRMIAGTAEIAEMLLNLWPEATAAVAADLADPSMPVLPGMPALAARSGASRAVAAARAVVATLPDIPAAMSISTTPGQDPLPFEQVWPSGAGALPAVDDGAFLTAHWIDRTASEKQIAVSLILPDRPGETYRVTKRWFYDLENEGQCRATVVADPDVGQSDEVAWLHRDVGIECLVASPHRDWPADRNRSLSRGPVPPLTTSMVAVLLVSLCHDNAAPYPIREIVDAGLVGSAAVTIAMRKLLTQPDVSPARMVKLMESDPRTRPVLWPVLIDSVRHAGSTGTATPRWLNRVLDVALLHRELLREAANRGLLLADAASWPGPACLAARSGSSTVSGKARLLTTRLTGSSTAP